MKPTRNHQDFADTEVNRSALGCVADDIARGGSARSLYGVPFDPTDAERLRQSRQRFQQARERAESAQRHKHAAEITTAAMLARHEGYSRGYAQARARAWHDAWYWFGAGVCAGMSAAYAYSLGPVAGWLL